MTCTIISWNVNGLQQRHQMQQFLPVFRHKPGIVCVQETKTTKDRVPGDLKRLHGYSCYLDEDHPDNLTDVILFSRKRPDRILFGFRDPSYNHEGRILIAEYGTFTLMNLYFPLGLAPSGSLGHKLAFYDAFLDEISFRNRHGENLIICGDFSIAHHDSDATDALRKRRQQTGMTPQEREKLDRLVREGFTDTFRMFTSGDGHYSWWPNGFTCRDRKRGLRLDYFFVNTPMIPNIRNTEILASFEGSDHCPIRLQMDIPEKGSGLNPEALLPVAGAGTGVRP